MMCFFKIVMIDLHSIRHIGPLVKNLHLMSAHIKMILLSNLQTGCFISDTEQQLL